MRKKINISNKSIILNILLSKEKVYKYIIIDLLGAELTFLSSKKVM